jgi:RNA polymerase sigma factor (sigma-70 family)
MKSTPDNNIADQSRLNRDRALVHAILRGSDKAWHHFLTDYSSLVYHVVRRHMFVEDDDEIRTVYVDILKKLHDGSIRGYENRAYLSTWLTVYTRARTFDYLRSRNGRYREPECVRKLGVLERRVLQMYYIEKQSLEVAIHTLRWEGHNINAGDVVDAIQQIEATLDRRYLRRIENENRLASTGASSVRMLKYLVRLQTEYGAIIDNKTPEHELLEKESRELAQQIRQEINKLDATEQTLLKLKFEDNLSAAKIAAQIGFSRPRQVYTALERVLGKLREVAWPDRAGSEDAQSSRRVKDFSR